MAHRKKSDLPTKVCPICKDEYIKIGQMLAKERLAYGGYRLADTLMDLWGTKEQEEVKFLW